MDSLRFTDHARGQDILHILSSKQTVEPLLIEASGHDMLQEHFQFMDKITLSYERVLFVLKSQV